MALASLLLKSHFLARRRCFEHLAPPHADGPGSNACRAHVLAQRTVTAPAHTFPGWLPVGVVRAHARLR